MNNDELSKKLEEMILCDLENLDFEEDDIVSANEIRRPKKSLSSIPSICYRCDVFNYGMSAENCSCCEGPKSFF